MDKLISTITAYWTYFTSFIGDFVGSIKDWILDLPAVILEAALSVGQSFLDWASTYCSYCAGNISSGGSVSVSVFAVNIQAAYDALSPCVVYSLTMSGLVGDLQTLSCAMLIWSAMRVISMVKGIL